MDREDPLFLPDPVISRSELWICAICGAVFGVFAGIYFAIRLHPMTVFWNVAIFLVSVIGCAWGAARYGDRFWTAWRR